MASNHQTSVVWSQAEQRCPDAPRMLAPFKAQLPRLRASQRPDSFKGTRFATMLLQTVGGA